MSMGSKVYPTDGEGMPVCARPTDGEQACLRTVSIPGTPCHEHRGRSPIEAESVFWGPSNPQWSL